MFSNEIRMMSIENRIKILRYRDPVANENIIRKLERNLRHLRLEALSKSF